MISILGLEPVCATWSLARRAPPGSSMPSAVRRTGAFIMGLSGLSPKDQHRCDMGNIMFLNCMALVRLAMGLNIRGYLEQPWTSMMFKTRQIQRFLQQNKAFLVRADMCQYCVAWKKPTGFLVWGVPRGSVCFKVCHGRDGRCSATNKKHLVLSGISGGKFLTSRAQEYPRALANSLMNQLMSSTETSSERIAVSRARAFTAKLVSET